MKTNRKNLAYILLIAFLPCIIVFSLTNSFFLLYIFFPAFLRLFLNTDVLFILCTNYILSCGNDKINKVAKIKFFIFSTVSNFVLYFFKIAFLVSFRFDQMITNSLSWVMYIGIIYLFSCLYLRARRHKSWILFLFLMFLGKYWISYITGMTDFQISIKSYNIYSSLLYIPLCLYLLFIKENKLIILENVLYKKIISFIIIFFVGGIVLYTENNEVFNLKNPLTKFAFLNEKEVGNLISILMKDKNWMVGIEKIRNDSSSTRSVSNFYVATKIFKRGENDLEKPVIAIVSGDISQNPYVAYTSSLYFFSPENLVKSSSRCFDFFKQEIRTYYQEERYGKEKKVAFALKGRNISVLVDTKGQITPKELEEELVKLSLLFDLAKNPYNAPLSEGSISEKQEINLTIEDDEVKLFGYINPKKNSRLKIVQSTYPMSLDREREKNLIIAGSNNEKENFYFEHFFDSQFSFQYKKIAPEILFYRHDIYTGDIDKDPNELFTSVCHSISKYHEIKKVSCDEPH